MDAGLLAQYIMNGLMLGMMYALVAVGFTLFFGVLDIIKFSHGDVLTVGAFTALAVFAGLHAAGFNSQWLDLVVMLVIATLAMAALGMLIARYLVMPLRSAPALNTLSSAASAAMPTTSRHMNPICAAATTARILIGFPS